MTQRLVRVVLAVLVILLTIGISPGFSQASSELKSILSQRMGLSQDQIEGIEHGQPFAKNLDSRSPAGYSSLEWFTSTRHRKAMSSSPTTLIACDNLGASWPSRDSARLRRCRTSRALDSAAMT